MISPKIPNISEEQRTPLVTTLLEVIQIKNEQIQALKDEVAVLKGEKPKPKIKPSKLETDSEEDDITTSNKKRPGSSKKSKKGKIKIHKTKKIKAKNVPEGSTRKGYEDFIVQGLVIKARNIRYRRERWLTPDGNTIIAALPDKVKGHFNTKLTIVVCK